MRAPYQVLIIPFRHTLAGLKFAVLKRSDSGSWQFVSGGGEGGVAKRQAGIHSACTRHNHLLRGNLRWFGFGWGQWKLGSALWWLLLSCGFGIFRNRFSLGGLRWVNRISGAVIAGFGLLALATVIW